MAREPKWVYGQLMKLDLWSKNSTIDEVRIGDMLRLVMEKNSDILPLKTYMKRSGSKVSIKDSDYLKTMTKSIVEEANRYRDETIYLEGGRPGNRSLFGFTPPSQTQPFWGFSLNIEESHFRIDTTYSSFESLVLELTSLLEPVYARMCTSDELDFKSRVPVFDSGGIQTGERIPPLTPIRGLYSIFSVNVFGPEYREFFGDKRLEEASGRAIVKNMDGRGSLLVKVGNSPLEWHREENIQKCKMIVKILDSNAFMTPQNMGEGLATPFGVWPVRKGRHGKETSPEGVLTSDSESLDLEEIGNQDASELRSNADVFRQGIKESFGVNLRYDRESLEMIDGVIDEGWGSTVPDQLEEVVHAFGAFVGEAMIVVLGGKWMWNLEANELCVRLSNGIVAMPFTKVRKRFENGQADSISFFLQAASVSGSKAV